MDLALRFENLAGVAIMDSPSTALENNSIFSKMDANHDSIVSRCVLNGTVS